MRCYGLMLSMALLMALTPIATHADDIPATFPAFVVPDHQAEINTLRQVYWRNYPGAEPGGTIWDAWLCGPALWPAVDSESDAYRAAWRKGLTQCIISPEGYVSTNQHASIAHPLGWPFPFWRQGHNTWGWHFSLKGYSPTWTSTEERDQTGWEASNTEDKGISDGAWNLALTGPGAFITTPPIPNADTYESPFIQFRWKATGLGSSNPYIEWTSEDAPAFSPDRRMYFTPVEGEGFTFTVIPMYRHPKWQGTFNRLRIQFDNAAPGATVGVQALFTQFDTRHNVNESSFIRGCAAYFDWTKDLDFLRANINRMREALRYDLTEFKAEDEGVIDTPWVGHEGRSGVHIGPDGSKTILPGEGIGANYWDLLPFGGKDAYATILHYDATRTMAAIERAIAAHPEWNMPGGVFAFDAGKLEKHAEKVKHVGNRLFWNKKTGRFVAAIDKDGNGHDFGFTFLNLEAIYYGFATKAHAKSILAWIDGDRIVPGDTSQRSDIYYWRFGPRATTKRNIEYYTFAWTGPETIPWGGQVQDGGAVLGFSYHDLMARLAVLGPDDAAARLKDITAWQQEVDAAGGYRAYYDGSRPGTLQGGGTAGGLGVDKEFTETILLPQVMLDGFLGLRATPEGFSIEPDLPAEWPELTITRIRIGDGIWKASATHDTIELTLESLTGTGAFPILITWPDAEWHLDSGDLDAIPTGSASAPGQLRLSEQKPLTLTLTRKH